MALQSLDDLYADKLKDLYSAENQILKALPKMVKAADTPELGQALQEHYNVTQGHVQRLEQIAMNLGIKLRGKKCVGMEGLLEEGKELLQEKADPDVMDAGIIGAAQSVEHYEIAGYGTARAFAQMLGMRDAANLLQQTLDEEKEADQTLTRIAENMVNQRAAESEDEDEEDEDEDEMEEMEEDEDEDEEEEEEESEDEEQPQMSRRSTWNNK
ncbi:MAG TPA: ferritin-like domain-containing protein [Anaerolineae bacterium]|nr:ferritin-like domain-containing protein [Anaerolineae bacterium]